MAYDATMWDAATVLVDAISRRSTLGADHDFTASPVAAPSGHSNNLTFLSVLGISLAVNLVFVIAVMLACLACRMGNVSGSEYSRFCKLESQDVKLPDPEIAIPPKRAAAELFTDLRLTPKSTPNSKSSSSPGEVSPAKRRWPWLTSAKVVPLMESQKQANLYSYRELKKATLNFANLVDVDQRMGSTFTATLKDGQEASVKVLQHQELSEEKELHREAAKLGALQHDRLVPILGFCFERNHRIIVFDRSHSLTLCRRLSDSAMPSLTWTQRIQIIKDVAEALLFLHNEVYPPVLHKDLRPENIFLNDELRAKVGEFGLSCLKPSVDYLKKPSILRGGLRYLDPEYLSTGHYSKSCDVYSFGVVTLEIISGRSPMDGLLDYLSLANVGIDGQQRWELLMDSSVSETCVQEELNILASMANRCLNKAYNLRPTMNECVFELDCVSNSVP